MSPISFVLELLLAVLLAACLYYCWRLDRKLQQLRAGQDGVREAAAELARATLRAQEAVKDLTSTARQAGDDLQERIDDARRVGERLGGVGGRR